MAHMNTSLARGYARQLIQGTKSFGQLEEMIEAGLYERVTDQFKKCCRAKKPDLVPTKLRRASSGELKIHLPYWTRHRATAVLDTVRSDRNAAAYNYFSPGQVRWREDRLIMYTIYSSREDHMMRQYQMSGPSIGLHAIARLLQRGAATPETLRGVVRSALNRARDAVALLKEEDDVFELLLPFAGGAIAVQVDGAREHTLDFKVPPLLSVRTYLTEDMLSAENLDRILDLEAFYLEGAWSDTDRYRELLEQNRSFMGNVAPEDRPIEAEIAEEKALGEISAAPEVAALQPAIQSRVAELEPA